MLSDPKQLLLNIFFGHLDATYEKASRGHVSFAHYSSIETIIKIIETKSIWLTNARCMNDYQEILHGLNKASEFFNSNELSKGFWPEIEKFHPNFRYNFFEDLNSRLNDIINQTYIFCLSEHDDTDTYGRLSMWRAYAEKNGAAMILDASIVAQPAHDFGLNIFPVTYDVNGSVNQTLKNIEQRLIRNATTISGLNSKQLVELLLEFATSLMITTKHGAFSEEREWRVIYRPWRMPFTEAKKLPVTIRGVPQNVHAFKIEEKPEYGVHNFALTEMLKEVKIGPTQYNQVVAERVLDTLIEVGCSATEAQKKLFLTDIPLRT